MPSKRILLLVLVCVSFVGFFVILKNYQNKGSLIKGTLTSPLAEVDEKDTDKDGLKDWEEVLLGTDPNKQDTDGDGISDKKEADDKTIAKSGKASLPQIAGTKKQEDLTETDKITRNIFYDYLTTKSSGAVNSAYLDNLAERAKNDMLAIKNSPPLYKKRDLKLVTGDSTSQNLVQYANNIVTTQRLYPVDGNNLSFTGITDAEDPAFSKWALKMYDYYQNSARAFLSVPVPSVFMDYHLTMVNDLSKISLGFKTVANASKDPLLALSVLPTISASQKEVGVTLSTIKKYLDTHGIIFSNELGLYILKPK
jgi:hypothetical protein